MYKDLQRPSRFSLKNEMPHNTTGKAGGGGLKKNEVINTRPERQTKHAASTSTCSHFTKENKKKYYLR
jgi:hypothetical protein